MTVSDILSDERLRQDEFPVCRSKAYLAHAGVAPLARCAADAIGHYSFMAAQDDQETWLPKLHRAARESATKLLVGAQPDEIAFIGPTSLALSMVAGGLTFRRSDNIVIYHDDFPSNVYPWMALAAHGVKVRYLNTRELGRIRPVDVLGQVDESTRLVALGAAHFISGWRIELDAIGKALRQRGILFCVDAMQTLGAFPLSVEHVDFLAADGHKWLLAPIGATVLFVTHNVREAVILGDRVVVMSKSPGRIRRVFDIPLSRPRTPDDHDVADYAAMVRAELQESASDAEPRYAI